MKENRKMFGRLFVLLSHLLVFCILATPGARGQGAEPGGEQSLPAGITVASVVVDGRELFPLRGIPSFPAAERARLIGRRIEQLAADPSFSTDQLVVADRDDLTQLLNGETLVLAVSDLDARSPSAT